MSLKDKVKIQWIWLGLTNGTFFSEKNPEIPKDIEENSWVVLVNQNDDLNCLSTIYKKVEYNL